MMKVPQKTQSRTKYSGELKPNDNKNEYQQLVKKCSLLDILISLKNDMSLRNSKLIIV
jgi:hypothetical protein